MSQGRFGHYFVDSGSEDQAEVLYDAQSGYTSSTSSIRGIHIHQESRWEAERRLVSVTGPLTSGLSILKAVTGLRYIRSRRSH